MAKDSEKHSSEEAGTANQSSISPSERWIDDELERLRRQNLERRTRCRAESGDGGARRIALDFATNDYLNLARSPAVAARAELHLRRRGAGAGASRLLAGTLPCHEELESRLASYKGYPSALVFGSGYMANAGVVPVLVGRDDHVVIDKLAHASIIDAAVLSRAKLLRFHHNDADHLAAVLRKLPAGKRCLVITESVFSMDGDMAPLSEIAAVAERHGAMLMVDEAHATGIFGPLGSGLVRAAGLESNVNICMGTLSKAFGGYGGFIACSKAMRRILVNRSRSFIFSTGLPPAVAGAALGALDEIEAGPELGAELLRRASVFRERLQKAGLDTGRSVSQIVPALVGDNGKALSLSAKLEKRGILAAAIRPPTVPAGTARLRFSVTLAHSPDELERAANIVIEIAGGEGLI